MTPMSLYLNLAPLRTLMQMLLTGNKQVCNTSHFNYLEASMLECKVTRLEENMQSNYRKEPAVDILIH